MQAGWCLLLSTQVWAIVYHTNSTSYIYIIFPGGGGGKKLDRFLGTSCSPVKWMISFQPCRFKMSFWHRLCVLMVAACLNENSQQDTGLQVTQIILTRRSCCLIYLRAVGRRAATLTPFCLQMSQVNSGLWCLRTCGGILLAGAAVAFEVSLWLGLMGKWPRDAIFITSAIISAVWELMVVFE